LLYSFIFLVIIFVPHVLTLYFDYPLAQKEEAARAMLVLHSTIWPWVAGIILFFGIVSIFISHKIAGPLYRLKKSLAEITAGNLNIKIKLRKNDDLKDLAEHINLLVEELRTFINTLKNNYDLLSDYITELERQIDAKILSEESGKKLIKKVQESRKNIEETLKKFNVPQ